ncbi:homeodomain transcription factor [Mycena metata]|uniref:Homeodomain transcription factor n=1 Tax=Mycena metata TaxID=1033252 RepID=A0AAD7KIG2_9AGAR|nr:homeodomain transcription factor [Mycena metata]
MSPTIPQSLTYASSAQLYALAISDAIPTQIRQRLALSPAQTVLLEDRFKDNSHPTLEERQRLAFQTDMEVNSITSWFQNKRKASSRRRAQNIATSKKNSNTSTTMTTRHQTKAKSSSSASSRRSSTSSTSTSTSTSSSASRRPSLDRVASRSELRAPTPRTPSRRHNPHGPLWANMASSPIGPPSSPLAPEFVDFLEGQQTRSLEWACARRRLAVRDDDVDDLPGLMEDASGGDTDVEVEEAVTPPSSCDSSWASSGDPYKGGEPDDETMKAALALCGLMRG